MESTTESWWLRFWKDQQCTSGYNHPQWCHYLFICCIVYWDTWSPSPPPLSMWAYRRRSMRMDIHGEKPGELKSSPNCVLSSLILSLSLRVFSWVSLLFVGFDGHNRDAINRGFGTLNESDFTYIIEEILKISNVYCPNHVLCVLEGGYNIEGAGTGPLAQSVQSFVYSVRDTWWTRSRAWCTRIMVNMMNKNGCYRYIHGYNENGV